MVEETSEHCILPRGSFAYQKDANRFEEEGNMLIKVLKFALKGWISSFQLVISHNYQWRQVLFDELKHAQSNRLLGIAAHIVIRELSITD